MKTETDDRELELVEHALSSRFISDDKKRYLRALKDKGAFKPIVEQVVDEDIEKEIDAYYTRAINEAKRTGRLKEPDENDPWFRERMNRMGRNTA